MLKPLVNGLWRLCMPHRLGQRLAVATALASTLMLVLFGLYSLSAQTGLARRMLERGHTAMAQYIAQEIARAVHVRESTGVERLLTNIVVSAGVGVRRVQVAGVADRFYDHPDVLTGVRPGLPNRLSCGTVTGRHDAHTWLTEVEGLPVMCVSRPLDAALPGAWLLIEFEVSELADIRRSLMFDTLAFSSLGALAASLVGLWIGRRTARGVTLASEMAERIETDPVLSGLPLQGQSLEVRRLIQALMRAAHRLRQQREALIDSQARNATVVNAALDAIVTIDAVGHIVEFNPAAVRTFGHAREAVLGRLVEEMLLPACQPRVNLPGGPHFLFGGDRRSLGKRIELTAVRCDGEEFPAEMAIVEHGGGGQRLYTAYVRDISERVAAAGALQRSERRHREVLESLGEVVFSLDMRLRLVYVNAAWMRLTGSEVSHALGERLTDFLDPRDVTLFDQAMYQAIHDQGGHTELHDRVEVRLLHHDGTVRWCLLECRVLTDAEGTTSGYGGSMIDVSAQRAVQMRLEDQLKFAETLVEAVPHALFVRDTDSRFLAVNRAFEELAGMERLHLLGQTPAFLLGESEELTRVVVEDRDMLADGHAREREMSLTDRESGQVRWFRQYKTVYRNAHGQPVGILGLITDITDQKESVDMLRKAAAAAEAANEAKSTFLANMSHEIRTPMNAIIGMTQLALEGPLNEDQRELIGIVQSSGQALLSLINDILDHSKVEAGRFDLEHQPFDLHECIALAVTMMREKAREKHLQLETAIAGDVPATVIGDGHRLRQIMLNLLSNAIKFTSVGGVQVVVTRRETASAEQVLLHVRVRDTGIGIPPDKLGIIFEPFTQADSSTTRRFGGTGLGLSVCQRIVGLMGGEMWVESQPGEGSTFHFTLALARADDAQVRSRWMAPGPSREAGAASTRPVRILVVERPSTQAHQADDGALHELLASWTAQVQVLPSMVAALAMLDGEHGPDGAVGERVLSWLPVVLARSSALQADDQQALLQYRLQRGMVAPVVVLEDLPVPKALRQQVSRCVAWPTDASTLFDAMTGAPRFVESVLGHVEAAVLPDVPTPPAPRRHRILLVEDNPINQKLALRLLHGFGHDVVVASDGAEAVERVSAGNFDLVFMDVQMPIMGGFEATDMIRRLDLLLNRHTPIVAMTAHAMSGDRERCLNAGMDGYISKPISRQDLQAAIHDHAVWQPTVSATLLTEVAALASAPPPAPPPPPNLDPQAWTEEREVFDHAQALDQIGGDEELFDELARIYLDTLATDLAKLARTARQGWLDELSHVAHAFKGSAAALGAGPAQALASDLEQRCRAGITDDLAARVVQLDAALRRLADALSVRLAAAALAVSEAGPPQAPGSS